MKMMKLFGLAAAAVCLLALAGCGGQSGGEAGYTKEQVQTILDSGAFTDELDELDCDTAWALYQLEEAGLSREDLTDGVIYRSAGATCEELSLLIFSDSGAARPPRALWRPIFRVRSRTTGTTVPGRSRSWRMRSCGRRGARCCWQFLPIPRRWRLCWDKRVLARRRMSACGLFAVLR